jgi:hypothetical protein
MQATLYNITHSRRARSEPRRDMLQFLAEKFLTPNFYSVIEGELLAPGHLAHENTSSFEPTAF